MPFSELLRQMRKDAGLTQESLAGKSGLPLPTIRGYEQGTRFPSWQAAVGLARGLGVSLEALSDCDEIRERTTKTTRRQPARKGAGRRAVS